MLLRFVDKWLTYLTSLGGHASPELRLFLRYSVGGGTAAVCDLIIVWLLVEQARLHPLIAGALSLVFGIMINFSIVRYWAFKSTDSLSKQFGMFMMVAFVGTSINYGSYALLVEVMHWWYLAARVCAIIIAWAWNYAINRRVTFKNLTVS